MAKLIKKTSKYIFFEALIFFGVTEFSLDDDYLFRYVYDRKKAYCTPSAASFKRFKNSLLQQLDADSHVLKTGRVTNSTVGRPSGIFTADVRDIEVCTQCDARPNMVNCRYCIPKTMNTGNGEYPRQYCDLSKKFIVGQFACKLDESKKASEFVSVDSDDLAQISDLMYQITELKKEVERLNKKNEELRNATVEKLNGDLISRARFYKNKAAELERKVKLYEMEYGHVSS